MIMIMNMMMIMYALSSFFDRFINAIMKRKTPDSDQLERHVDELPKDLYKLGVQLQAHERDHVGQRFTTNPVRASARIISYIHRRVGHFCISTLLAFLLPSFLVLACGWEMFFGSDRSGSAGALARAPSSNSRRRIGRWRARCRLV